MLSDRQIFCYHIVINHVWLTGLDCASGTPIVITFPVLPKLLFSRCLHPFKALIPLSPCGPVGPLAPFGPSGPRCPSGPWRPIRPWGPWFPRGPRSPWGPGGPGIRLSLTFYYLKDLILLNEIIWHFPLKIEGMGDVAARQRFPMYPSLPSKKKTKTKNPAI